MSLSTAILVSVLLICLTQLYIYVSKIRRLNQDLEALDKEIPTDHTWQCKDPAYQNVKVKDSGMGWVTMEHADGRTTTRSKRGFLKHYKPCVTGR